MTKSLSSKEANCIQPENIQKYSRPVLVNH